MTDAIRHRGPDGEGHWLDTEAGVALGHRRLAILDLSAAGAQPMVSPSGRYVLTYNGEIYNYLELRLEEDRHGASWRGNSDTEVFLVMCDRLGVLEAVRRSSGMFAMGIWDRAQRELTLVRDRIGEKPLYYGWSNGVLLFGSELKALRPHPRFDGAMDHDALALFMRHSYVPSPRSIYAQVRKLVPGATITFRGGNERWPEPDVYWSLRDVATRGQADPFQGSDEELTAELERVLSRVIRSQMAADVPLGGMLSGGIDSTAVVALMQDSGAGSVRSFTIGFEHAGYDEAPHAAAIAQALGTTHTECYVSPSEALATIPRLGQMYDEPFADASQIPTALLAAMAREHVAVALSGDGGDETFAGYDRYLLAPKIVALQAKLGPFGVAGLARILRSASPSRWDQVLGGLPISTLQRVTGDRLHKFADLVTHLGEEALYDALITTWRGCEAIAAAPGREHTSELCGVGLMEAPAGFLGRMQFTDALTYLPDDIFVKVDRAAMACSLECRAPLAAAEVFEFAWRIPRSRLTANGVGKLPLRRLVERYVAPELIERPKQGFGVPLEHWMRRELREWVADTLTSSRLESVGLSATAVQRKMNEHLHGRRNWQYHLWPALMLCEWAQVAQASA